MNIQKHVFGMIRIIKNGYVPKLNYPVGLCNWNEMCLLWGRNWIHNTCYINLSLKISCHGSRGQWPASQRAGWSSILGQSVWDLWWTKWHWDKSSSEQFCFPPVSVIPPMIHTHLHLQSCLTQRNKGRRLGTFQQKWYPFKNRGHRETKVGHIVFFWL